MTLAFICVYIILTEYPYSAFYEQRAMMAKDKLPDRLLAKLLLPAVRETADEDYDTRVRERVLNSLLRNGHFPSTVTEADLSDVEGLITKLEAIASEG